MSSAKAYCFNCKGQVSLKDAQYTKTNNKNRVGGTCSQCNRKVSSFIPRQHIPQEPSEGESKEQIAQPR